jgi:hypothetical protein
MRIASSRWTSVIAIVLTALWLPQQVRAQVFTPESTIPAGISIPVRTSGAIDANAADGRIYTGVVDADVTDSNGRIAIPRGSTAELTVRRNGNEIALDLESISVNGQRYAIASNASAVGTTGSLGSTIESGASTIGANKTTGEYVGGGALLGTIVGAIAGGGKGAAIGAAVGAAAGAGAQIATHGKTVNVPAESLLTFQLTQPLTLGIADAGYSQNGFHYHHY